MLCKTYIGFHVRSTGGRKLCSDPHLRGSLSAVDLLCDPAPSSEQYIVLQIVGFADFSAVISRGFLADFGEVPTQIC